MVVDNKATITYVQLLKEDLVIIRLVPKDGPVPEYQAGQFITLGLPNPAEGGKIVRRAYSIASHPENRKYIELVIRWVRKPLPGRLTTQIFNAKEGDEILWLKPTGRALLINDTLPNGEPDTRRIVCIGGGTGLAPFVSFAQHLHAVGDKREVKLEEKRNGISHTEHQSVDHKSGLTDLGQARWEELKHFSDQEKEKFHH